MFEECVVGSFTALNVYIETDRVDDYFTDFTYCGLWNEKKVHRF